MSNCDSCSGCPASAVPGTCESAAAESDRLSAYDLDELKKKAIELHAGEWLHHYGQLVEEEVLRRHGLLKG